MLPRTVLILDDDRDFLERLALRAERREDFQIETCDSVDGLAALLETVHPDCILLDYVLGDDIPVERVATNLRSSGFLCPIVLVSQYDCSEVFRKKAAIQKLLSLGVRLFLRKGQLTYTAELWLDAISFVIEAERHITQTAVFADVYFYSSQVLRAHADLRASVDRLSSRLATDEAKRVLEDNDLLEALADLECVRLSASNLSQVVEEIGISPPERDRAQLSDAEIAEGLDRVSDPKSFAIWFEQLDPTSAALEQISEPTVDKFLRTLKSLDDKNIDQQRKFFLASVFGRISTHLTSIDKSVVYSSLKAL